MNIVLCRKSKTDDHYEVDAALVRSRTECYLNYLSMQLQYTYFKEIESNIINHRVITSITEVCIFCYSIHFSIMLENPEKSCRLYNLVTKRHFEICQNNDSRKCSIQKRITFRTYRKTKKSNVENIHKTHWRYRVGIPIDVQIKKNQTSQNFLYHSNILLFKKTEYSYQYL